MIIYKVVNKINGKIYVGQTAKGLNLRIGQHIRGKGGILSRALQKYGIQSFEIAIIDVCSSKKEMDEKEKYWIAMLRSKAPHGYNLTDGGDGILGCRRSEETRKKQSEAAAGTKNHNWGISPSEESNRKRSLSLKGKLAGDKNPSKRAEVRAKMSAAKKGRHAEGLKRYWETHLPPTGSRNPQYGIPHVSKGKTYEEMYGPEKAAELKAIRSEFARTSWRDRKNREEMLMEGSACVH